MSSLALYRSRVPAHASVPDATVEDWLEQATAAHTASAWGDRYALAMIWWAAHHIERTPGLVARMGSASEVGAVTAQSDSQTKVDGRSSALSRSYAAPGGSTPEDIDLRTTRYGQLYLSIRHTRAARAPFVVSNA